MPIVGLDPTHAAELLRHAEQLQTEAAAVIEELDLLAMLGQVGHAELVGSAASGLMVWRDIDVGARCQDLNPARAWDALRPLVTNPQLMRLDYRNEIGERSPSDRPSDQRYSFVAYYQPRATEENEWRIDISLWLSAAPRNQLAQLAELRRRLTDETRLAILWIKDVWHRQPTYPYEVGGVDVYDAVLEHGVRTPDEFAAHLRARGRPAH